MDADAAVGAWYTGSAVRHVAVGCIVMYTSDSTQQLTWICS